MHNKGDGTKSGPERYGQDVKPSVITPEELRGSFGPRPIDMTIEDLIREATYIGIERQWDRYLAQIPEEKAADQDTSADEESR